MNQLPVIVVVDHEGTTTKTLYDNLQGRAQILGVTDTEEAELALRRMEAAVVVCRDDLPSETGIMFLTRYRDNAIWQRRILLCPPLDSELALFLINETNIFRCVTLPTEPAILVQTVESALAESERIHRLFLAETENERLRGELQRSAGPTRLDVSKNWIRSMPRVAGVIVVTFAGIFALGVIVLLSLYVLKSLLGIDLIPGAHLSDALK